MKQNLTKQYLIRLSPELDEMIDEAFSKHLKKTGEYIAKSEFVRRLLQEACSKKTK
jgi:hypothetical protein